MHNAHGQMPAQITQLSNLLSGQLDLREWGHNYVSRGRPRQLYLATASDYTLETAHYRTNGLTEATVEAHEQYMLRTLGQRKAGVHRAAGSTQEPTLPSSRQ